MSNEPTPRTDSKSIEISTNTIKIHTKYVSCYFARQLERELAKATKQRDVALSDLEFRRDLYALQTKQLTDMTVQRDRMAEALRVATAYPLTESWYKQAIEALDTLKP